jgi:TDG/mug DNA glycosylase family protein
MPRRGLPDHVRPGLRVLFVGINPGLRSAAVGHHYAGYSNRFWKLVHESGLVPEPLKPERDAELLRWGMGLTNLVARPSAGVGDLGATDFARGRRILRAKIRRLRPGIVALVGLTVYDHLFPRSERGSDHPRPRVGLQPETLHGAQVFVLPNTSGRNAHYTYTAMLEVFRELARQIAQPAVGSA